MIMLKACAVTFLLAFLAGGGFVAAKRLAEWLLGPTEPPRAGYV